MLHILSQAPKLRVYIGKFILVGLSGIVVNQGLLTILTLVFHLPVSRAGIIGIETSILSNFLLNNYWIWQERRNQSFIVRFLKYHMVTALSGGINYLILIEFTALGMHHLIANLFGIGFGMVINFLLNHFWTFQN
jgi:dolichol-phosphate mannosyltransferase